MQRDKDQQKPGQPNKQAARNPQGQDKDQQRKDQKKPFER